LGSSGGVKLAGLLLVLLPALTFNQCDIYI
jgi:hypothetical protein